MIYGEVINNKKRTQCKCVCECGSECIVVSDKLISGRKISCGCDTRSRRAASYRIDLTGQRFGRLVVEKMLWDSHPTKAVCKCDCGNTVTVINTGLSTGKTSSCGCLQKEIASKVNTKDWRDFRSEYGIKFISQSHKNSKGQWIWNCECGICGKNFTALPAKIINGHITSCGCRKRSSREELIKVYLDSLGLTYKEQYRISECRDRYSLPFDFAVIKDDGSFILIEYDGIQHYRPSDLFGGQNGYEERIRKDNIKNEFCLTNNIPLLRLPYTLTDAEIKEKIINTIYP